MAEIISLLWEAAGPSLLARSVPCQDRAHRGTLKEHGITLRLGWPPSPSTALRMSTVSKHGYQLRSAECLLGEGRRQ